jgi:RNA polymerase sigma-70 factor, ECF subfamily
VDETELIERAGRGEAAAVRALYDTHSARVWAVVRRLAGEDSLAEDWAQEAWIKVFRSLAAFRGEARVSTWIHRIAVNAAVDGQRRRARERPIESFNEELDAPRVAGSEGDVELKVALERALDRLPHGMRQVLVLHDVEGYTHEEIGTALGVAAGTSRSQLFKARARLRESLVTRPRHHRRTPCSI